MGLYGNNKICIRSSIKTVAVRTLRAVEIELPKTITPTKVQSVFDDGKKSHKIVSSNINISKKKLEHFQSQNDTGGLEKNE